MKAVAAFLGSALLILGCGGDSSPEPGTSTADTEKTQSAVTEGTGGAAETGDAGQEPQPKGTAIVTGESEFGEMLFDERDQAIYVFENDPRHESACYGECAEAWPPVLTKGEPVASGDVETGMLGTVERDDGSTQVTYAGRPLYFYAHEAPGEVRCHNVDLNGGLWWVVGPDGKPRP